MPLAYQSSLYDMNTVDERKMKRLSNAGRFIIKAVL
jgi:hypothetical protein